jgi:hypothetical protein
VIAYCLCLYMSLLANFSCSIIQVMGSLFRLRNVTIVGYFYYLILHKLLHVSVVRPSSGRNILARITRLTTNPLFLEYSY